MTKFDEVRAVALRVCDELGNDATFLACSVETVGMKEVIWRQRSRFVVLKSELLCRLGDKLGNDDKTSDELC